MHNTKFLTETMCHSTTQNPNKITFVYSFSEFAHLTHCQHEQITYRLGVHCGNGDHLVDHIAITCHSDGIIT